MMWPVYGVFAISLIFCAAMLGLVPRISSAMDTFARGSEARVFPNSSPYEYNKFAILRILFGIVIFVRGVHVCQLLLHSELTMAVGLWSIAETLAGALLILGFLTQWALVFLIGAMWQYGDLVVGKATLGNDVAAILGLLLLMVNAGRFLSLDALLIKRVPALHSVLLYYRGLPSREGIFYAKLAALTCYWAVCIYSIAIHLNEPAWTDGSAGPLLLSNNFMSTWHAQFSTLFSTSPLAVALAKGSLWMMMLWYAAVLPFVLLGGLFRQYVIVWGWLFFALSMFALQLGYLAEIEVLLWLGIFWSIVGIDHKKRLDVLYDDRCNLCDRTVQAVTLLDIFGRIRLRPLSQNKPLLDEIGLDVRQALTDLYGVRENDRKLYKGYDFYIQLSKTLVLLWPVVPFLLLGKALAVGPAVYRFIAARRTRLFGVCELPRQKFQLAENAAVTQSRVPHLLTLHVFLLLLPFFLSVPAPYVGWSGIRNVGARAAHIYGITPINVFNKTDLRMAENWFLLKSIDFNETVPLFAEDGSRLSMHASDRVYFGHTVLFRRKVIGSESCQFEKWARAVDYLSRIYLQERGAEAGQYTFNYRQIYQPLVADTEIAINNFPLVASKQLCEHTYTVNYQK
ncbi:putative DCC family thiol-disulfide oxidoreductase YuxK [Hydrogenophaga palleronii]|uniref:DCC family thiol-disulfide oxidoreductase YuxK n=1 Tax=Hydrogenophaga palleronii TaxID=65655 RepID=A0ABU1WTE5_9BURK|nr:DCC1-like thiol-disulfide oxidoreductase family protein [Hydrogenophaga palleronii]MDR7152555.1 putative DCC family thiol-disulfide oxidoreductase YuxK [Hydrogenophaga palleronii]